VGFEFLNSSSEFGPDLSFFFRTDYTRHQQGSYEGSDKKAPEEIHIYYEQNANFKTT
jgi:hypothetical protein